MKEKLQQYLMLDIHNKLVCNIRDLGHTIRALSEGKASQSRILIVLKECESITQNVLTERLGVQPGTISEVLGKLEKAKLIIRVENEKDKRTCELRLTDEGIVRATKASMERKKRYEEMFTCLSEKEKNELLVLLEKVNSDWAERFGDKNGEGLNVNSKERENRFTHIKDLEHRYMGE